jgi:hypothetical protein
VRDHEEQSGSTVGLTDQTTLDLNGIVIPLRAALHDAGKDVKSLSLPSPVATATGEGRGDGGYGHASAPVDMRLRWTCEAN